MAGRKNIKKVSQLTFETPLSAVLLCWLIWQLGTCLMAARGIKKVSRVVLFQFFKVKYQICICCKTDIFIYLHSLVLMATVLMVIFARGKFKFELFLNGFWYEPETLWLFLTFPRDYSAEKKIENCIKFSGDNIFLYREQPKNRSSDMQEQFQSQK